MNPLLHNNPQCLVIPRTRRDRCPGTLKGHALSDGLIVRLLSLQRQQCYTTRIVENEPRYLVHNQWLMITYHNYNELINYY